MRTSVQRVSFNMSGVLCKVVFPLVIRLILEGRVCVGMSARTVSVSWVQSSLSGQAVQLLWVAFLSPTLAGQMVSCLWCPFSRLLLHGRNKREEISITFPAPVISRSVLFTIPWQQIKEEQSIKFSRSRYLFRCWLFSEGLIEGEIIGFSLVYYLILCIRICESKL